LEQQEQETLASLLSKEKDLKKRRELLEWEIDQEMNQVRIIHSYINYIVVPLD